MELTAVSLFAGVGGFDLAMERAGISTVATVEINPAANTVLERRFPFTHRFTDITEVTSEQLRDSGFVPDRGILVGGFPCQDVSVAGKRAGLDGERSGLYWEIVRLIDELSPDAAQSRHLVPVAPTLTSHHARNNASDEVLIYDITRALPRWSASACRASPMTGPGGGQSDSARYRQMGNAVAVPVVEWILKRLVEVDGAS